MNPPRESTCCFGEATPQGLRIGLFQPDPVVAVEERLLVQELNQLSVQEREQVYNEIHGVAESVEETPEFLQRCCQKLQAELRLTVGSKQRRAYDKALFLKPSLEDDVKFQLMFLRAERYDVGLAAKRIYLYFENKLLLFGEEKLAKDITLDDLDEDDIEASRLSGLFTRIPEKDRSGRTVLFSDARTLQFKTWQNVTRALWYIMMNDFTDEETQKTGIVNVTPIGKTKNFQQTLELTMHGNPVLLNSLPLRYVAIHFYCDNPSISPVINLYQRFMGTSNRIRFRAHYGSEVECQYKLMSFGIHIPESMMYGSRKEWGKMLTRYLAERKKIEQEEAAAALESLPPGLCALYPGPKDILMGRGQSTQLFPGNIAMVAMLGDYRDRYYSSKVRLDKTFIAMDIYHRISSNGGRFLERVERQGWKMVDKELGEQKILRALRNYFTREQSHASRSAQQQQQQQQQNEGSDSPRFGEPERMKKRFRREPVGDADDTAVGLF